MGEDYSILLKDLSPDKAKAPTPAQDSNVHIESFLISQPEPVPAVKEPQKSPSAPPQAATRPQPAEEDKNLFTVIEEKSEKEEENSIRPGNSRTHELNERFDRRRGYRRGCAER